MKLVKTVTSGIDRTSKLVCAQCLDHLHYMSKCTPLKVKIEEGQDWQKGECQMCDWRKGFEKHFCSE